MPNLINDLTPVSLKSNTHNIEIRYPLLAMEKGLLFHALFDDNSSLYMSQGEYLLHNIDPQLFWKAWQHITQHYEVLRSCFIKNDAGLIEHVVYSHVACAIQMINLSALSTAQAEDAYQKTLQQEIQTPFDLTTSPLMRLVLCQMSQQTYRFIWTYHHLLLDLRSTFQILDDVMRYCEAMHHHQIIILPPAVTKGEILAQLPHTKSTQTQAYWQNSLKNYASTDELPFISLRNQTHITTTSLEYIFSIENSLYLALKKFAYKYRLTPGLIIHTAWGLTLCSYLNRDDIVFGTIRSLPYALIKHSAGLFINNLPMRIRFNSETSVLDCLNDAREQHRQLKQYWNTALGDIQSWMRLSPEQNLFNTCISFSTQEANALIQKHLGDQFKRLEFKFRSNTHYPLMLEFFIQGNSLLGRFTAQQGLFSQQMMEHISSQLSTILQKFIKNPQQKICQLSWLSAKNYQQLNHWNKTAIPIFKRTLTSLLEEQTYRTPERIAVQFEDKALNYHALNASANKLAYWLRQQGIRPNATVGIYMERCLELPIALLGVVKSSGAYLPFDPKIPIARLADILKNSHTTVLLTTKKFKKSLLAISTFNNLQIIYIDEEEIFNSCSEENLNVINDPYDDLYVIYTSGSTGKPKGVRNHHLGIVNQLQWMQKTMPLHKNDKILQKTTLSFDVSVWEFFWPWLAGAQIVLMPPDRQYSFNKLTTIINQKEITILQFVPTQLDNFVQEISAKTCHSIRYVLSIGEPLKQKTAEKCLILWPNAVLYNLYGPTETSIASTYYVCKKNDDYGRVPIGKPIGNTQLFVLNRYQQLAPIGGIGELYIGGIGVAKGYLNQPELTAKHFIKNPLQSQAHTTPTKILYKTGDLVMWSPKGELHFIGRIDNQVKRHGTRVELSEIEYQLLQQNSIKQCVVVLQKDQDHEYLVAYCVATNTPELTLHLYKKLAQYLPNYMIPTHFIWLKSLPLLTNGKLDRAALPRVNSEETPENISTPTNRNMVEKLQTIWQEVLRLESIGIHDNLFTIGGDSISVIQIANKARASGIDIKPKWIFNQPTIAGLSELASIQKHPHIKKLIDKNSFKIPLEPIGKIIQLEKKYNTLNISTTIKSYGIEDIYPLSPLQQGILFHSINTKTHDPYICQYSFTLSGDLNLSQFRQAWQKLVCHYDMLKTGFFADNKGRYSQVVLSDCPLPMDIVDLSSEPYPKAYQHWMRIIQKDKRKNFSFDKPPLFRIVLAVLANNQYACLLSIHHTIHDAWSIILLFENLHTLYNYEINIFENDTYKDSRHYKDFVTQQLTKDHKASSYWKKLLAGFESALQLDICSLHATNASPSYSCQKLNFNDSLCKNISNFAKFHQTTVNIVIQSAWTILLNRYTHQQDIIYGTVLSGRTLNLPDIEKRFGLFLQTIPIRIKLTELLTVTQLMQHLSSQFSTSSDYAHYPLSDIQSDHFNGEKKSLFDYVIIFENYPSTINMQDSLVNLTINDVKIHALTHYSISLLVMTEPNMQLNLFYDNKIFTRIAIKNFLTHFETLLEEIIKSPKQPINKLSLLSKKQLKDLMIFSEGEKKFHHKNIAIYELFHQQALKNPEKTALIFKNGQLTYKKLNNAVLHLLRSLAIQSGETVGLYFSQDPYLIISILALLSIGCTYVPIDPKVSQKYIKRICSENQISVILTNNELYQQISALFEQKIHVIAVNNLSENNNNIAPITAPSKINNHNAYIMYTSGSTGKTKGVAISQSSIINLFLGLNHHIQFQSGDCFLATTAYTFDISVIEWLLPLVTGGTCIVLSPEQLADDCLLNKLSNDYNHMFIQTTPSVWHSVLSKPNWKINCPLTILVGGEILGHELAKKLLKKSPHVWNCYGPTETTIWSTIYKVNQLHQNSHYNAVPIGKPLLNTTAYVLDEQLNPMPVNLTGELYLGGSGLMQTYIGEHASVLNKEKLISNPFNKNELLYKTGDKVCWLPDGNLQFLGRFDDQVKIRGFRIDLNQIASVLETHDFVKKAIVVKQDKQTYDATLIAYLLLEDKNVLSNTQIEQIHCEQWAVIYDRLYQQSSHNSAFDTTGWVSSYTGKPFPAVDMQEWVKHTVDSIIALAPQKVLEIGCGMGLLLLPITPLCQSYHGTDISSAALTHITKQLINKPFKNKVTLSPGNANALNLVTEVLYDTVIINSVIQYFPYIYYLYDVLNSCINSVSSGGQVFIGDVRSYTHLKHFHASVVLHRASHTASLDTLKHRYFKYLHQEKELVIDPLFFIYYAQQHARISHVAIQLKAGQCENEMNDYRYDVILHIEKPITKTVEAILLDWQQEQLTPTVLTKYLAQQSPMIYLANIPNAHWVKANKLIQRFESYVEGSTLAECTESLIAIDQYTVSPFDLTSIAAATNYEVFCTFSEQKNVEYFDAILCLKSSHTPRYLGQKVIHQQDATINWQNYANKPWQVSCHKKIHDILHQHLLDKLPYYMAPSAFIVIDDIPITTNGKLNTKVLANYARIITAEYQAANTEIEQLLINIWRDTLGIHDIGVKDNFFQLGGHSLNALHVIHAITERWHISLDVVRFFEMPTVFELAQEIQETLSQAHTGKEHLSSSLVTLSKTGEKPPLFLIHPVGGTVFCYIPLTEALSIDHPIIGIQDPGITTPDMLFHSLPEMATHYIRLIKTKQANGPYYLAGASLGGTLAAEMAHQLTEQGDNVRFIGLFDTWAAFTKEFNSRERLEKTLWRQYYFLKERLQHHDIANPKPWLDLNYQRLQLLLQYQHPMIKQPMHLFKAQDIELEYQDLNETSNHWSRYTTQPVKICAVPGNHESILVEPNVTVLAKLLTECLEEIDNLGM